MNKGKTNFYDFLKTLVQAGFAEVNSTTGKINLSLAALLGIVLGLFIVTPMWGYVVQIFVSLGNLILLLCDKTAKLSYSPHSFTWEPIACLIMLFIEIILCSLIVYFSEKHKEKVGGLKHAETDANQTK